MRQSNYWIEANEEINPKLDFIAFSGSKWREAQLSSKDNEMSDKYTDFVSRAVEKAGASSPTDRFAVYEKLRSAIARMIDERSYSGSVADKLRHQLEQGIKTYEASLRPSAKFRKIRSPGKAIWFLAGLLIGASAGASLYLGALVKPARSLHDATALDAALEPLMPALAESVAFLEKVRTEVEAQHSTDPFTFAAKAGDKFIPLKLISPSLAEQIPSLVGGKNVQVRANTEGYKILHFSPLCTTAKFVQPALVDPIRDNIGVGCSAYGFWTEDGAVL